MREHYLSDNPYSRAQQGVLQVGLEMKTRINVIDSDVRRRARVSRDLNHLVAHVEIFEDVAEFAASGMLNGVLFVSGDPASDFVKRIEEVRTAVQAVPMVGYAEDPAPEHIVAAMRAGVLDYLGLPFDPRLVDALLRRVMHGNDPLLQQELVRSRARASVRELTGRETDVLALLVQGLGNKGIGNVLGISPRTVEIHRANMMGKLGAQSSPDAIRIGIYAGFDEAPPRELSAA
jgi:FixJ family two-component response regulator